MGDTVILTSEIFGDKWPFIIKSVKIKCIAHAITLQAGPVYALNGIAANQGYKPLDDTIWKDNLDIGAKMSLSPILNYIQKRGIR